jgi:glycosyltransferase involved in cell wall biosynthesis
MPSATLEASVAPRISIAMPVYNGQNYIAEAVQSVLAQDFTDFELIITDNASTDSTAEIYRAFATRDTRIRYHRNDRNIGAAANFNLGYELSTGEYFKWCAHDDFISPNFLSECVRPLDSDRDIVIAYGRQQGVDEHGSLIPWHSSEPADMTGAAAARRFKMVFAVQGFDAAMFGLIRRSALAKTSLHRNYYSSDVALLAELALLGAYQRVPEAIFYNREHPHRSINIADKRARQVWHDPSMVNRRGLEHLSLLRHLFQIAFKHRHIAPLNQTIIPLWRWALTPLQLSRYAIELIGVISPSLQVAVRRGGWQGINALRSRARSDSQRTKA